MIESRDNTDHADNPTQTQDMSVCDSCGNPVPANDVVKWKPFKTMDSTFADREAMVELGLSIDDIRGITYEYCHECFSGDPNTKGNAS